MGFQIRGAGGWEAHGKLRTQAREGVGNGIPLLQARGPSGSCGSLLGEGRGASELLVGLGDPLPARTSRWGTGVPKAVSGRLDTVRGTWEGANAPLWVRKVLLSGAYLNLTGERLGDEGEVERDKVNVPSSSRSGVGWEREGKIKGPDPGQDWAVCGSGLLPCGPDSKEDLILLS